ncbi:MAG: hypothetical protein V1651_03375 [Patescibacteria group bacterium]
MLNFLIAKVDRKFLILGVHLPLTLLPKIKNKKTYLIKTVALEVRNQVIFRILYVLIISVQATEHIIILCHGIV